MMASNWWRPSTPYATRRTRYASNAIQQQNARIVHNRTIMRCQILGLFSLLHGLQNFRTVTGRSFKTGLHN